MIPFTLPVIDVGPYLSPSGENKSQRLAVSKALHEACRDYGFFYLKISGIAPEEETTNLIDLARSFFASSQEEKDALSIRKSDNARGYQRLLENVTMGKADNHEALDLYAPVDHPDKMQPLQGENQWPDIPGFKDAFDGWVQKMKKLGLIVMEAMAVGLGMAADEWEELRGCVDDSFWVLRIIGYPPLPPGHDGFSCGAHKDYGCLTFVHADETRSALQVLLRSSNQLPENQAPDMPVPSEGGETGGTWINADPLPGHVICNIGEMVEVWTNGLYKSTVHRVYHISPNYRVSLPFFFEPNFDAVVKPLAAALRQVKAVEGQYTPVVYGEFLKKKVGSNFTQ